jgi:hypothetical protein
MSPHAGAGRCPHSLVCYPHTTLAASLASLACELMEGVVA